MHGPAEGTGHQGKTQKQGARKFGGAAKGKESLPGQMTYNCTPNPTHIRTSHRLYKQQVGGQEGNMAAAVENEAVFRRMSKT